MAANTPSRGAPCVARATGTTGSRPGGLIRVDGSLDLRDHYPRLTHRAEALEVPGALENPTSAALVKGEDTVGHCPFDHDLAVANHEPTFGASGTAPRDERPVWLDGPGPVDASRS